MNSNQSTKTRYHLIDALRGLSVVLMLGYHFGTTLIFFGIASEGLIYNPLLNVLEPVFAGLFILISGICCRFARSNVRRGFITLCFAAVITVISLFLGLNIWFGILHFLGLSMVVYGLTARLMNKIPLSAGTVIWLSLFVFTFILFPVRVENNFFCWLGFASNDFFTADFFPFLKWFPLFLLGTQLGLPVKERKLPKWFYEFNMPFLPPVGRHALFIYMAHQPVFALICLTVSLIIKKG